MSTDQALWNRGYRYALALTGDGPSAEDLLHDGWASALRARPEPSAGYLFRAIRSRWIDRWRRTQRVPFEALRSEPEAPGRGPGVTASDRQRVQQVLATLKPDEREVIFLAAVEGYTATEIGELTERPRGTVLSLLHRARQRVRNQLLDHREVMS